MSEKIINCLVELGGNLWQKYDKNRIYFDNKTLAILMGYRWNNYNTGNINYATLNDERISNSEMKRVLNDLDSKIYYDLDDGKFHWYLGIGMGQEHTKNAIELLKIHLSEVD